MNTDSDLTRAVVEPLVLRLVSEKAMYGYEIIKVVNQRTKGTFEWKEGTLYPVLHRLEGAGLIKSEWTVADSGRNRKYYSITRKGAGLLKEKVSEWAAFSAAVQAVLMAPQPQGLHA
jgi:DNA-binding PadR family transcriptional regulator